MATSVFTQCDGAVYTVKLDCADEASAVFKIMFDGSMLSVPVTGFTLEQSGNFQFLHTINNFVYAYVFGDRVGELRVSGMGFVAPTCGPAGGSGSMCELHAFYQTNKLSRSRRAMAISLGGCGALWGFLTGMRLELPRPDVLVGQWALQFNVLPQTDVPTAVDFDASSRTDIGYTG